MFPPQQQNQPHRTKLPSHTRTQTGRLIRIGLFESLRLFVRVNPLLERVIDSFYSPLDIGRESINRLGEPRVEIIPTMKLSRTLNLGGGGMFCGVKDTVCLVYYFTFGISKKVNGKTNDACNGRVLQELD